MNKNVIYMTDEYIYLYNNKHNKKIKVAIPKNIVVSGKIANINKFISKYENILKDNKLNTGIIGDKIKIIVNPKYTSADITLLKNIFEKLNYRKIMIDNELKYYKLTENNAWINVTDGFVLLTFINYYKKKETILIEKDFFSSTNELFKYIKSKVENKDIYLIGTGKLFSEFENNFERIFKNKTYLFTDSEYYLINCIANL